MSPIAAASSTTRTRACARVLGAGALDGSSRAGAPVNPLSLADPLRRGKRRGLDGQKNRARGAIRLARGRALHLYPAVMVLDDAVAHGQAQAGPLTHVHGGEEGLVVVL